MAERFIQTHIKRLLLFERLPDDQLALLADAFQVLRFEPGTLVFQQGQPAQGLFYFVSGRGVLTRVTPTALGPNDPPHEELIGEIGPNEYVGEQALFEHRIENASLRVVESAIVLFLSRQRLANLLLQHPELRVNLGFQRGAENAPVKPLFKGQRSDEVVLQMFRRHWWSFGRFVWIPLLIATALIAGAFLLVDNAVLALSMVGIGLIIPAGIMWFIYVEWQDDAIIVTDHRVVRVHNVWLGLSNSINEIPLERVLEVSVSAPPADPFARIFKYGTVTVKTPGQLGNVSMAFIPNPDQLRSLIFTYRERARQSTALQQRREILAEVDRVLGIPSVDGPSESVEPLAAPAPSPSVASSLNPLKMTFINENGDTVIRKHVTVWLGHVLPPFIALMIVGTILFLSIFGPPTNVSGITLLVSSVLLVVVLVWLYLADWDWRYDQFILSEDMITFIRRRPLWLQNEIDQVRLSQVDSVISIINGLSDNLLDKGTVRISLVGSDIPKEMRTIHHPREVQAEISLRQARMRSTQEQTETERQRQAIAEYLTAYHERVSGADAPPPGVDEYTIARDVSSLTQPTPTEPPPQPIHDANRPPRVPRVRPDQ